MLTEHYDILNSPKSVSIVSEILVWTGTHPDEKKALEVGDSLRSNSIPHVTTDIANQEALSRNVRLIDDINLMGAYPGDAASKIYTIRRAAEILEESQSFNCVIDVHDVLEFGDTTAVIDRERGVTPRVLGFLGALGVKNLVLSTDLGMHHYIPNSFVLEMGLKLDLNRLRAGLGSLANDISPLQPRTVDDFKWFEFLESLHVSQFHPDRLSTERFDSLRPFTEFPELTAIMGRKAYLMQWMQPNKQGYWGELVTPTDLPDTSQWPGGHTRLQIS